MRPTGFCCPRSTYIYNIYIYIQLRRIRHPLAQNTHSLYNNGPKHSVLGTSIGRFVNVNRIKDFWTFRTLGNMVVWKIANHSEKGHGALGSHDSSTIVRNVAITNRFVRNNLLYKQRSILYHVRFVSHGKLRNFLEDVNIILVYTMMNRLYQTSC